MYEPASSGESTCAQAAHQSTNVENDGPFQSLWKGTIPGTGLHPHGMKGLARDIAALHGVDVQAMMGQSRAHKLAQARQHFMWVAYEARWADGRRRYSMPQIGKFLDGRDHSTVHHGIKAHVRRMTEK